MGVFDAKAVSTYLDDVTVGAAFMRLVVLGILEQHLVHVGARILEQLVGTVEDDERKLAIAQNRQFVRFLHQTKFALGEGNLCTGDRISRVTY